MNSHWKYTAAEKRAVDAAYAAVCAAVDLMGWTHPANIQDATRYERRNRSCLTVARALIVEGYLRGMQLDPPASDLADLSSGIATAVMLGAKSRKAAFKAADDTKARVMQAAGYAAAAHDAYLARGIESCATSG